MKRLENKVALISGATRGIGRTSAELFVSEGASVVICGRDVREGEKVAASINADHPHKAAFCALDVTIRESWEKAIAFAKETFGELNILINNAGTSYREALSEITDDTWNKTVATNQTGVFYGMQLGIEAIAENGKPGAVVNTASVLQKLQSRP